MAFQGSLKELPLPDIIQLVSVSGKTGKFTLSREQERGYIFLKKPRLNVKAEIQYRFVKWRINRMRKKFDVYSGGRADDINRRVH